MNRIKEFLSLLVIATIALHCRNRTVFHTGTFEGKTYTVTEIETKGFSTNSFTHELKLPARKAVKINVFTTNWGPPYADDLYGSTPRVYIPARHNATVYYNSDTDSTRFNGTMLYLSPDRFSRQAFDDYARLMKQVWPAIDKKYADQPYTSFPNIIGLVYGNQEDFTLTFEGKKEGQAYTVRVEPDGRIIYTQVNKYSSDEYSGLSLKVQMPGKRIVVSTQPNAGQLYSGVSMAQLKTYRDKKGNVLGDYFTLVPDPNPVE